MWSGLFLIDAGRKFYLLVLLLLVLLLILLLLLLLSFIVIDIRFIIWYLPRHIPQPKTLIPTYIPNHYDCYPPIHPIHALPNAFTPHQAKPRRKKNRNKVHPTFFFFPPLKSSSSLFLDVPSSSFFFFFSFQRS